MENNNQIRKNMHDRYFFSVINIHFCYCETPSNVLQCSEVYKSYLESPYWEQICRRIQILLVPQTSCCRNRSVYLSSPSLRNSSAISEFSGVETGTWGGGGAGGSIGFVVRPKLVLNISPYTSTTKCQNIDWINCKWYITCVAMTDESFTEEENIWIDYHTK